MSFPGIVSKEVARREEGKLRRFTVAYLVFLALSLIAWLVFGNVQQIVSSHFWFTVGSFLAFGSTWQRIFLDVKKNSNPKFANVQPGTFSTLWEKVERAFKYLGIAGILIMFVAHWL